MGILSEDRNVRCKDGDGGGDGGRRGVEGSVGVLACLESGSFGFVHCVPFN